MNRPAGVPSAGPPIYRDGDWWRMVRFPGGRVALERIAHDAVPQDAQDRINRANLTEDEITLLRLYIEFGAKTAQEYAVILTARQGRPFTAAWVRQKRHRFQTRGLLPDDTVRRAKRMSKRKALRPSKVPFVITPVDPSKLDEVGRGSRTSRVGDRRRARKILTDGDD